MGTSSGQEDKKETTIVVHRANGKISSDVVRISSEPDQSPLKITGGPGYVVVEDATSSSRALIIQGKSDEKKKN